MLKALGWGGDLGSGRGCFLEAYVPPPGVGPERVVGRGGVNRVLVGMRGGCGSEGSLVYQESSSECSVLELQSVSLCHERLSR